MKQISQLIQGSMNPYDKLIKETRELTTKWESTGLLEGLSTDIDKAHMSILFENQCRELLSESSRTGTAANSEQWSGVALPLVRRIFAEIASKEFVSVQPMNLPSGLIFYLDFKYGTDQAGKPRFLSQSLFGGTGTKLGSTDSAVNGLYGAGRFGYSSNDYVSASATATEASASWFDVQMVPELSSSIVAGTIKKVTVALGGDHDTTGVRAFSISGSGVTDFYPAFTKLGSGNNVVFFVSASTGAVPATVRVEYHKQPAANTRGDFEDIGPKASGNTGLEQDVGIPEINIEIKNESIVAKTKKLKAVWTPELAQDLNAYHSVDAESELTGMLSEYVSMEIDLEILDMLITAAPAETTEYWSARPGYEFDSVSQRFEFDSSASNVYAYTKNSWYQTLGVKIQKVSNRIHQLTLRGGANFLVCSPSVATILESIPGFVPDTNGDKMTFSMGVSKVGSFANRWTVYKNPYMTENVILVGFRGKNFFETGAVYAPYIPLIQTPVVYDPVNFTPRRGVLTRYAKKVVRPEFYGKIVVAGLNYV